MTRYCATGYADLKVPQHLINEETEAFMDTKGGLYVPLYLDVNETKQHYGLDVEIEKYELMPENCEADEHIKLCEEVIKYYQQENDCDVITPEIQITGD